MRFSLALAAGPLLATAVSAFVLPLQAREGVYRAYYDENGKEVHELLTPEMLVTVPTANTTFVANHAPSEVQTRATSGTDQVYCGCGFGLDHQNCDDAVQDIKNQVGGGVSIPKLQSYYSIRGAVVFFACNYQSDLNLFVWADQITTIASRITNACGLYIAGTVGEAAYGIGYMQYTSGLDFCSAALSSGWHSC